LIRDSSAAPLQLQTKQLTHLKGQP